VITPSDTRLTRAFFTSLIAISAKPQSKNAIRALVNLILNSFHVIVLHLLHTDVAIIRVIKIE